MKKEVKIRPFWYSDVWLFPKLITIITSLDAEGRLNAAPYSHIMQYDVMAKRPRMMVGFRQDSHTFENICATGEFVINCPPADYLEDMMETARFYPGGRQRTHAHALHDDPIAEGEAAVDQRVSADRRVHGR